MMLGMRSLQDAEECHSHAYQTGTLHASRPRATQVCAESGQSMHAPKQHNC